jgi:hypothetical protein
MRLREFDTQESSNKESSNPCEVAEHKVNFRQHFLFRSWGGGHGPSCPLRSDPSQL